MHDGSMRRDCVISRILTIWGADDAAGRADGYEKGRLALRQVGLTGHLSVRACDTSGREHLTVKEGADLTDNAMDDG